MKKIIGIVIIGVLVLAVVFLFVFSKDKAKTVSFTEVDESNVPSQITEILPNHRMKEKALVCKLHDEVYVIVTRGEKMSAGYDVKIKKIYLEKKGNKEVMKVVAEFTDPKPGTVQAQIVTYPYAIVKTELNELPKEVILEKEYKK